MLSFSSIYSSCKIFTLSQGGGGVRAAGGSPYKLRDRHPQVHPSLHRDHDSHGGINSDWKHCRIKFIF